MPDKSPDRIRAEQALIAAGKQATRLDTSEAALAFDLADALVSALLDLAEALRDRRP